MILKIFSVYDQAAKAHLAPFFMPNQGQAIRSFTDACNDKDHQFGKHPEDYTISEIGLFDDDSGKITPHTTPEVLGTGVKFTER